MTKLLLGFGLGVLATLSSKTVKLFFNEVRTELNIIRFHGMVDKLVEDDVITPDEGVEFRNVAPERLTNHLLTLSGEEDFDKYNKTEQ